MPVALDRRVAYFAAERLSDNVDLSPEGYLICRNVVIGRTGFQTYKVSEVDDPEELLDKWDYNDDKIDLWRDPSEVFSPATIASFEGKTFTLTHPGKLLTPETERENFIGNFQNVRPGTEPLSSGALPLLADVIIKVDEGIDAFRRGMREVSCGYSYRLAREGYRWDQRDIRGNHAALVDRGRAGHEARINDSAVDLKENQMSLRDRIRSLGWKAFVAEAKPEEVAAALEEETKTTRSVVTDSVIEKKDEPKFVEIGTTSDGVKIFKLATAKDAVAVNDGKEEENKAAIDKSKRMHDMLDRMLKDSEEESAKRSAEEDADVTALADMVGKFTKSGNDADKTEEKKKEEAEDVAHPEGCRCDDCMDKRKGTDEKEEKKEEEADDAEIVRAEPVLAEGDRPKNAFDAAMTMDLMKSFRTIVAKSTDIKVKAAFDVIYQGFRAALKAPNGSGNYATFRAAASKVADEKVETAKNSANDGTVEFKPKESAAQKLQRENDLIYADAGKKQREKTAIKR